MDAKATHKSAKCSPRKARLLRGLIIGQTVARAVALLLAERRAGSVATVKLIRSALAQLPASYADGKDVVIKSFVVDEGMRRRMFMPRAQGRATPILKRTSHLTVLLEKKG